MWLWLMLLYSASFPEPSVELLEAARLSKPETQAYIAKKAQETGIHIPELEILHPDFFDGVFYIFHRRLQGRPLKEDPVFGRR